MQGNVKLLRGMIGQHPGLATSIQGGWTLLHRAAASDQAEVVRAIVDEYEVHVDLPSPQVTHPDESTETEPFLFQALCEPRAKDKSLRLQGGFTPLMAAVSAGALGAVSVLLELGASPSRKADDGTTSMRLAAANGRAAALRMLAAQEMRVSLQQTWSSRSPAATAALAALAGDSSTFFSAHHHDSASKRGSDGLAQIHRACVGGNIEIVQRILSGERASVSARDEWGRTPLHWTAIASALDVCRALLAAPAGAACAIARDSSGRTPAEHAARHGEMELYSILAAAFEQHSQPAPPRECYGARPALFLTPNKLVIRRINACCPPFAFLLDPHFASLLVTLRS